MRVNVCVCVLPAMTFKPAWQTGTIQHVLHNKIILPERMSKTLPRGKPLPQRLLADLSTST